jgi:hypothetical protein
MWRIVNSKGAFSRTFDDARPAMDVCRSLEAARVLVEMPGGCRITASIKLVPLLEMIHMISVYSRSRTERLMSVSLSSKPIVH